MPRAAVPTTGKITTTLNLFNNNNDSESPSTAATTTTPQTSKTIKTLDYVDDCFGLIFLTSSFVINDIPFATTFFSLSLIALLLCRQGNGTNGAFFDLDDDTKFYNKYLTFNTWRKRIPSYVALLTLLITPITTLLFMVINIIELKDISLTERLGELIICTISILYGIFTTD